MLPYLLNVVYLSAALLASPWLLYQGLFSLAQHGPAIGGRLLPNG